MLMLSLNTTIWTGKAKLEDSDTPGVENFRPPASLASGGTIKIYDPRRLDCFQRIKASANRFLESRGLKLMGGFLIDPDQQAVDKIELGLANARSDWDREVAALVAEYPVECQAWQQSNGQWAGLIASKQPSVVDIGKRFKFGWATFDVNPRASTALGNSTGADIQELPDRAMQELCDKLYNLYSMSFANKPQPSAKAWQALSRLHDNARALAFINPDADRLAELVSKLVSLQDANVARVVLGQLDDPCRVLEVLDKEDAQGLDSFMVPEPVVQPTSMSEPVVDDLLVDAQAVLAGPPVTIPTPEAPIQKEELEAPALFDSLGLF